MATFERDLPRNPHPLPSIYEILYVSEKRKAKLRNCVHYTMSLELNVTRDARTFEMLHEDGDDDVDEDELRE